MDITRYQEENDPRVIEQKLKKLSWKKGREVCPRALDVKISRADVESPELGKLCSVYEQA